MKFIILVVLLVSSMIANAQNYVADTQKTAHMIQANPALDAELHGIVHDAIYPLASLSVLAVRGGKVVYQQQFGHRFIDEVTLANSKPANADTLYRIASISKLVTTLGVMKLMEEGQLKLDTDISDYLGYKLRNPNFPDAQITLRMLLSHTSSLRDDAGYFWGEKIQLKDVLVPGGALYDKGNMWSKNAGPGAIFSYANLPWGVVAGVMERVSGERFDRLMARLILQPMNLHGGFSPADMPITDWQNIATLYRKRSEVNGKEIWQPNGPWVAQVDDYSRAAPVSRAGPDYVVGSNGTLFSPQGGIRLSAFDLGKLMLMLINNGSHDGKRILKKATVEMMLREQWRANGKNDEANDEGGKHMFNAWGLGNQHFLDKSGVNSGDRLVETGGVTGVGHLGDAWGLNSAFVFNRANKSGVIFLAGGPGFNPETTKGKYSALYRYEEQILDALFRRAAVGKVK